MIQLQITVAGYAGKACTVLGAYDPAARVLTIVKVRPYTEERLKPQMLILTNCRDILRDQYYPAEKQADAIRAYFEMASGVAADGKTSRLVVASAANLANPAGQIQLKEIQEKQQKYELNNELNNAAVATLLACLFVINQELIENTITALDDMAAYTRDHLANPVIFI